MMKYIIRKYKKEDYASILDIYSLSKLDEVRQERAEFKLIPLVEDNRRYKELFESDIFVYDCNGVVDMERCMTLRLGLFTFIQTIVNWK